MRAEAKALRRQAGAAFHVCDWLLPTEHAFRPGNDGRCVINIPTIRSRVEAESYDAFTEVEIFSANDWWRRDPDDVLEINKERFRLRVARRIRPIARYGDAR